MWMTPNILFDLLVYIKTQEAYVTLRINIKLQVSLDNLIVKISMVKKKK